MTDTQMFTIALAIIFPLGMLLYSNSRITDTKETLRAEIRASHAELLVEMRQGFTRIETALKIHELEHHQK